MENAFKRFFTYVLNEYCEETCTSQDEIFNLIDECDSVEQLAELFIDEGFLKWIPSEFICRADHEAEQDRTFLDFDEQCAEQYWETICENMQVSLDDILEYL